MTHQDKSNATAMNLSPGLMRRFSTRLHKEVFLLCRPEPGEEADMAWQTSSAYRMLEGMLRTEGGSLEHVVQETVFFRNIGEDCPTFLDARRRTIGEVTGSHSYLPASILIGQPPLDTRLHLEISATAFIPDPEAQSAGMIRTSPGLASTYGPSRRAFLLEGQKHVFVGNIYGDHGAAFDESYSMFRKAEELLRQEGMTFKNVIRTWIHLRHMDRDYAALNQARREFFHRHDIKLLPASTGIEGAPYPAESNLSLSLYAVQPEGPLNVHMMTTPTLNEACQYGSDFSRGLKMVGADKVALYISGTASVDENGRTAHLGDFEAQVDRMLLNISKLLENQAATFRDVVSAITYLKNPSDAPALRNILHRRSLDGFPNALVHAAVCRPDLLCEMEAIAVLPV